MSKTMSPERKGEIALALLEYIVGEEGVRFTDAFRRKLGQVSKASGISMEELTDFSVEFIQSLIDKHIKPKPKA